MWPQRRQSPVLLQPAADQAEWLLSGGESSRDPGAGACLRVHENLVLCMMLESTFSQLQFGTAGKTALLWEAV